MQYCPLAQPCPQVPQFAASAVGSTHVIMPATMQTMRGAAHVDEQWLALQNMPLAHAVPQLPQFAPSLVVSTQRPWQSVWPIGHAQLPIAQVCGALHALPQLPQFASLVWSDAQMPLQRV
jgi:hypothetical protein